MKLIERKHFLSFKSLFKAVLKRLKNIPNWTKISQEMNLLLTAPSQCHALSKILSRNSKNLLDYSYCYSRYRIWWTILRGATKRFLALIISNTIWKKIVLKYHNVLRLDKSIAMSICIDIFFIISYKTLHSIKIG